MDNENFLHSDSPPVINRPTFHDLYNSVGATNASRSMNSHRIFRSSHLPRPVQTAEGDHAEGDHAEGDIGTNGTAPDLEPMSIEESDHMAHLDEILRHMMMVSGHQPMGTIFHGSDDIVEEDGDVEDSLDSDNQPPGIAMSNVSLLRERGQRRSMKEDLYDEEGVRLPDPVKQQRLLGGGSSRRFAGTGRGVRRRGGKRLVSLIKSPFVLNN